MTETHRKMICYQAKEDLRINGLPFFFGCVEIYDDKISGRHYKPKFDKKTETYVIGYYNIEGEAADFLRAFETHGNREISQEAFNAILSQWTEGGVYSPMCWGLGEAWEIAKAGRHDDDPPLD